MRSDLGPRRLGAEKYVTVMSTVSGCDVTTVQQHYKGSTSTLPRVARLCQIREESVVALRKSTKSTLAHRCRSFDSSDSPYVLLATRLVTHFRRLVSAIAPIPSINFMLWNRSRPNAFAPMSLGFASLLSGHHQQFQCQILNVQKSRKFVFHLATRSLFRCNCACCAAVCSRVNQE